ncbi:MAG: hypothetical protein NZ750_01500 [Anaerolineae bacterium]|nr:hypothetical protein [Anaerolineae bacterium]MDW8173260.1 hypothetical protein [Anaerolineae bacterium]
MTTQRRNFTLWFVGVLALISFQQPVQAQAIISNSQGTESKTWTIIGEPTLVMNGFDLSQVTAVFPVTISAVSIQIVRAVPGQPVSVVIYEDPNGGSPADARLIHKTDTTIDDVGNVTVPLAQAVDVNSPVVWVGFYLPIGTRFRSDQQGSSVLTYWAWNPGDFLDLVNLGAAQVFGPSDGSDPVKINLGGVARISFTAISAGGRPLLPNGQPLTVGRQLPAPEGNVNIAPLRPYSTCGGELLYDQADIDALAADSTFSLSCTVQYGAYASGIIANQNLLDTQLTGLERRGPMFHVIGYGNFQIDPAQPQRLRVPVTHCLRVPVNDIQQAVLGVAYGVPMAWEILPSIRYNDLLCAELTHTGPISYFMPRTGQEDYRNLNLMFARDPSFSEELGRCRRRITIDFAFHNEGFETSPSNLVRVENVVVRTGDVTLRQDFSIQSLPPATGVSFRATITLPETFVNEQNRLVFTIDPGNQVKELIESDNVKAFNYILRC